MLRQPITLDPNRGAGLVRATDASAKGRSGALNHAFAAIGAQMVFERNVEIFGESEPAEFFYQVVSGAVRTHKMLEDGRRQIGGFYLPGEVFGLEAGEEHGFGAEAVVRSVVRVAKRSAILAMAERDPSLAQALWSAAAGGLRAAQEHMLVLGRKTAEERVATFLLDIARREDSREIIELPMSRQDIADYLGLTIETISRTMTLLENEAAIELPNARKVVMRSKGRLQALNA
jgi:CRP/FNR family transcriptional regulator, nitrogen fixation regulation protein